MKPTTPQGRLLQQWQGHVVQVDAHGLAVDGQTIDPTPLTERDAVLPSQCPLTHPAFQLLADGGLVYRGHVQAHLEYDQVTVYGPQGAAWPPCGQQPPSPADEEPDNLDFEL
ncbi:hypothetical protein [Streptomyces sp. NPDC006925]|uniref:hypothetical protein n=1 Tax=Streptomyces sp. NPDC006925 TaxID=3364768 RepID=UPI0036B294AD